MPTGQADPQFEEGLAHLQAGKWQDAIRCFEALLRQYPNSRPVQQALDEARFKASIRCQDTRPGQALDRALARHDLPRCW